MSQTRPAAFSPPLHHALPAYLEVLKPRETGLITFIGLAAAVVAGGGRPPLDRLALATLAIAIGSAGVNGLTNYLDRDVDGLMERTRYRALPSGRIRPPEKALAYAGGLTAMGLFLAWLLNPWAAVAGLGGTAASVVGRKTSFTHALGGLAGVAPVAVGWLAVEPRPTLTLLFLILLVMGWVPLHVWSLMLAYREDYLRAGLRLFPVSWREADAVKVLWGLCFLLYGISLAGYWMAPLGGLYLTAANLLGLGLLYGGYRLWRGRGSGDAWRLYRLLTYPYPGIMFVVIMLDAGAV